MNKDEKQLLKLQKEQLAFQKEKERFYNMQEFERAAYAEGCRLIAGVDEAGRGPLAGPVVAACVILPGDVFINGLNDSKKLSAARREALYEEIFEKAVSIGIGTADEKAIDEKNILNATKQAMREAISAVKPVPDIILIDAVKLEGMAIRQIPIIKGDSLSISIAAASVIAKVTRDRLIDDMDNLYPLYGFKKHKGYGTEEHINAIKKYGICPIHRISFIKNFV